MADSKRKRGKADRSRVSGSEPYEVYYVARKFGVSADTVRKVIKRVGNSRKKVYAAIEKMSARRSRRQTDSRDNRAAVRAGANLRRANFRCSAPELPLVTPPIVHRLVGNPAVIGAIGQFVCRVPATEEEVRAAGITDRPTAGLFRQLEKGLALLEPEFRGAPARVRRHSHRRARYCRASMAAAPASYDPRNEPCAALEPSRRGSWRARRGPGGEPCQ